MAMTIETAWLNDETVRRIEEVARELSTCTELAERDLRIAILDAVGKLTLAQQKGHYRKESY